MNIGASHVHPMDISSRSPIPPGAVSLRVYEDEPNMNEPSADRDSTLRGWLKPISTSAARSIRQMIKDRDPRHSSGRIPKRHTPCAPLTPDNSEDEGEPPTTRERAQADNTNRLPLQQSDSNYSFSLGTAPGNYLILSHEPDPSVALCWINSVHCCLCPDPDEETFWIRNSSTSECFLRSRPEGPRRVIAKDTDGRSVGPGEWELHLGQGLDFLLEILPRKHQIRPQVYRRLGQTGPLLAKPQVDVTGGLSGADQSTPKDAGPSRGADASYSSGKHERRGSAPPRHHSSNDPSVDVKGELAFVTVPLPLARTGSTQVFVVIEHDREIVLKLPRQPKVKGSIDRWTNERDMLESAGLHVSHKAPL